MSDMLDRQVRQHIGRKDRETLGFTMELQRMLLKKISTSECGNKTNPDLRGRLLSVFLA